ncbi:MAG: RpiB/LacA/LacB family sugar-phosphate isomerase [Candidatus Electrothrix sp. AR3]|nr:RpiB/LacA/LacB family sugar-phosphate isomerase [Candidatus Electrothrix sp. AR3]
MKIAIGADLYGFPLKEAIKTHLLANRYHVEDLGIKDPAETTPYYATAEKIAQQIIAGEFQRGILVCGTGMGMAIVANKHPGIYAAVCESTFSAEKSRSINNSNVLTLGSMLVTEEMAKNIVDIWLQTEFTHGWESEIQEWLMISMQDISSIEKMLFK